jgi:hypothetical protein
MIDNPTNSSSDNKPRSVDVLISSSEHRHKRPGVGGWLTEMFQGWQLRKSVGDLVRKLRRIDRPNDHYVEHVETKDGTVLHHCDEPLSSHRGHGSAKGKT